METEVVSSVPSISNGRLQLGHQLFHDRRDRVGACKVGEHHEELVAALPADRVGVAHAIAHPRCNLLEQRVPGRVPEGVVDGLEVVEVEKKKRDHAAGAVGVGNGLFHPVAEEGPVGQLGERVLVGEDMDALFGDPAVGDVAEAPHPAGGTPVDELREGIALEYAPVLEFDGVDALGFRVRVELLDLGDEGVTILHLVEDESEGAGIVSRCDDLGGNPPHLHEAPVEPRDAAVRGHHEDAVRGRVERRAEQGHCGAQVFLGALSGGDVVADPAVSGEHAGIVEDRLAVDDQVTHDAVGVQP